MLLLLLVLPLLQLLDTNEWLGGRYCVCELANSREKAPDESAWRTPSASGASINHWSQRASQLARKNYTGPPVIRLADWKSIEE